MLYAAIYTNTNYVNFALAATNYIILAFSNPMDPVGLSNMGNYTLPAGLTLLGVMVNSNDYRSVALAYSGTPTRLVQCHRQFLAGRPGRRTGAYWLPLDRRQQGAAD